MITGATGAVGGAVLHVCRAAGASVRTLQRSPVSMPGVDARVGDLTRPETLAAALEQVDVVIHLAGLLHVSNPPPSMVGEYQRVNDEGTAHLVRACSAAGVSRLVYASTIAVYGPTAPGAAPATEDARCAPDTPYARTKLAGERHLVGVASPDGTPLGVTLRLAAVYGPGVKGNYQRLVQAMARGLYVPVGPGTNRRTLVHESDAATAVLLAATGAAAAGRTFNVTDGKVHEVRVIVAAIASALGRRPPRLHVPAGVARTAAATVAALSRVLARPAPVTRATIDKLLEDVAVDGTRVRETLGFVPAFDLRTGWRDVIDRMRAQGLLPAGRTSR